jgi:hypothetical protein
MIPCVGNECSIVNYKVSTVNKPTVGLANSNDGESKEPAVGVMVNVLPPVSISWYSEF